jgi:5'-3' exonuclease
MKDHLEDLFQSINDIYYQVDEGKISPKDGEMLAQNCSKAFINDGLISDNVKTHLMLSLAFGRGIIDGEQLKQLLTIYKDEL